ncbi:WD40 repeat-like protein [Suillus decipiens]|nr:WD40 repeat-like protein [Suillus decipiens]
MAQLIPTTTPIQGFEGHDGFVSGVAVFPDKQRMVTSSQDKTLRLWDIKEGVMLKKMEQHCSHVWALVVSRHGNLIASGGANGELVAWDGTTGEPLTKVIKVHTDWILSLDFSLDDEILATGSYDSTARLWNTKTWQEQGNSIQCGDLVYCVRYSPSGEHLAIATKSNIQIWKHGTRECVAKFQAATNGVNFSLTWTPNGTRILSVGQGGDCAIREWHSSTWQRVGDLWEGHSSGIRAIALNSYGTLVASASEDNHVRLWRLSDRQTIAIFKHSDQVHCVIFSADGRHIFSGGNDRKISKWQVPEDALPQDCLKEQVTQQILDLHAAVRNACMTGDMATAEGLLTKEIDIDADNYNSYANRSIIMARQLNWDHALNDAIKSVSIEPSFIGHVSKGLALCGKQQVWDATKAFDLAFTFTNADLKMVHFLFLIRAMSLFNANKDEEALLPVQQLAVRPNADPLVCRVVEACMRVQLGKIAMDGALYGKAADHFTAAVNASASFAKLDVHAMYEDFVVVR